MEKLDQASAAAINQMMQAVDKYGAEVATVMVQGATVGGVQPIVTGIVAGIIAVGCFFFSRWAYRTSDGDDAAAAVGVVSAFIGLGTGITAAINLGTVSAYYALFNPKVYMAHKVFSSIFK